MILTVSHSFSITLQMPSQGLVLLMAQEATSLFREKDLEQRTFQSADLIKLLQILYLFHGMRFAARCFHILKAQISSVLQTLLSQQTDKIGMNLMMDSNIMNNQLFMTYTRSKALPQALELLISMVMALERTLVLLNLDARSVNLKVTHSLYQKIK